MAKLTLKNVRLTFPQLWEAKQVNGQGEAKYSAAFLFKADHPCLPELRKAVFDAAKEKWGDAPVTTDGGKPKYEVMLAQLKAQDRLPVHDGDAKSEYDGYAGHLFVNSSNKIKPLVIDGQRNNLVPSDGKPYSGCFVNAIVEIWAQDNQFGKRVNASLLGVQFLADGERLAGGSVAAADDFEAIPVKGQEAAAASGQGAKSLF